MVFSDVEDNSAFGTVRQLGGRPDRGLLRGVLRFLRFPSVPLGMLVI